MEFVMSYLTTFTFSLYGTIFFGFISVEKCENVPRKRVDHPVYWSSCIRPETRFWRKFVPADTFLRLVYRLPDGRSIISFATPWLLGVAVDGPKTFSNFLPPSLRRSCSYGIHVCPWARHRLKSCFFLISYNFVPATLVR